MGVGNQRRISREKPHILVDDSHADVEPPGQSGGDAMFVHLFETRFGEGSGSDPGENSTYATQLENHNFEENKVTVLNTY